LLPTDLRYLTFVGHELSSQKVQVRITADANASGTTVVANIFPPLCAAATGDQNINKNIIAGMTLKVVPSHVCGVIMSGNPLFLAMPQLPEEVPFPTAGRADPDSGVAIRSYYGSRFGMNERGFINDAIWGSTMVDYNAMRICFPI
jgi:hypothetical protein